MNETLLRDASVQDIQLELLRRTRFNALDGERVCASLLSHRHLWKAALLDRPGVPDYSEPGHLLIAGLIKLRDLPHNLWNADTLFLLTPTHQAAEELARVADTEDWGGEVHAYTKQDEMDRALARAVRSLGCCPSGGIESTGRGCCLEKRDACDGPGICPTAAPGS